MTRRSCSTSDRLYRSAGGQRPVGSAAPPPLSCSRRVRAGKRTSDDWPVGPLTRDAGNGGAPCWARSSPSFPAGGPGLLSGEQPRSPVSARPPSRGPAIGRRLTRLAAGESPRCSEVRPLVDRLVYSHVMRRQIPSGARGGRKGVEARVGVRGDGSGSRLLRDRRLRCLRPHSHHLGPRRTARGEARPAWRLPRPTTGSPNGCHSSSPSGYQLMGELRGRHGQRPGLSWRPRRRALATRRRRAARASSTGTPLGTTCRTAA